MSNSKKFIKNSFLVFFSKIFSQFLSLVIIPIYTFFLTTNEYGSIDLIVTYIGLIIPILSLQLDMSVFRFLVDSRNNSKETKKIITNSLFLTLIIIFIISIIYLILIVLFKINYITIIYFIIILMLIYNILLQICRGIEKTKLYCYSQLINATINFILVVVLLILNVGLYSILFGLLISNLISVLFLSLLLKIHKYINIKLIDKKLCIKMIKYSLPLVPNTFSWWIINVSDRTIISLFLGLSYTGIYAISNKISNIFTNLFSIINITFTETVSESINEKNFNVKFSKIFSKTINLFGGMIVVLIPIISILFPYVISNNYGYSYNLIPILLFAALLNGISTLLGSYFIASKETKTILYTSFIAAIINFVVNIIFIKYIGVFVAAVSTIISYLTITIIRYLIIKKQVNLKLDFKSIFNLLYIYIGVVIIYYYNNLLLNIICFMFSTVYYLYFNRSDIKTIITNILKK